MNILILDPGRQALPFLQSYSKKGYRVFSVCFSPMSMTFFSRYPYKRLMWPNYNKFPNAFFQELLNFVKTHNIDFTLALGDITAEMLSQNKEILQEYTNFCAPPYEVFNRATDKLKLMQFCMENSIPCPLTFELSNGSDLFIAIERLSFPVIVKPRRGIGAVGVTLIKSSEELQNRFQKLKSHFGDLLVQEFIPQNVSEQYQSEVFVDRNHESIATLIISKPRYFPISGGTSTANVTVCNNHIKNVAAELLRKIEWIGAADIDFIFDRRTNTYKVLEINPRVTAGIKIAFRAGIDFSELHLNLALSRALKKQNEYKLGVYCRNIVLDILWYVNSSKATRKSTSPSFFDFFGKNVCYQTFSIDDPLTGLGFILSLLKKYSNIKLLRKKFAG